MELTSTFRMNIPVRTEWHGRRSTTVMQVCSLPLMNNTPDCMKLVAVAQVRNLEFTSRFQEDVNFSGFTALHYAVILNDHNIIKILLENGMD